MARSHPLTRYSRVARHYAFIQAIDAGFSPKDTVSCPKCIEYMIHHAEIYSIAYERYVEHRPSDRRPVEQLPFPVPEDGFKAGQSAFETLSRVGIVRGLYVVLTPDGKYSVTLKVLHPRFGNAYRYGKCASLAAVWDVLYRWVEKDYWTPDKLKT